MAEGSASVKIPDPGGLRDVGREKKLGCLDWTGQETMQAIMRGMRLQSHENESFIRMVIWKEIISQTCHFVPSWMGPSLFEAKSDREKKLPSSPQMTLVISRPIYAISEHSLA